MRRVLYILSLLLCTTLAYSKPHVPDSVMRKSGLYVDHMKIYSDSAIYQGINLKLDLFNTVFYLAKYEGKMQTYEMAMNVRLKQRFFPTLELGYAKGEIGPGSALWNGQGGWANIGLDINGLKKSASTQNGLLVGIRVGTAVQKYDLTNVPMNDPYWRESTTTSFVDRWRTDCWGEVVAGCQVQVYGALMMGWYIRLKMLFTRKMNGTDPVPYYIPGFGYRDMTQWGINYYIGWKF